MRTFAFTRDGGPLLVGSLLVLLLSYGCASKPEAVKTGYLSDYSLLEPEGESRIAFRSPRLGTYTAFIVDPIEIRLPEGKLSAEDRAEAARYFRRSLVRLIEEEGLGVTETPGVRVARMRVALTDIAKSTWWQKIHPVGRLSGAGTGGAAMEAEVVDSVTGEQLAAVVQSGAGNQFNMTAFSTLDDVKGAIDAWSQRAARNLRELREQARRG